MAKWAPEEVEKLREYADIGLTAKEAARALGRPDTSISSAAYSRMIKFDSPKNTGCRDLLNRGGFIQREDFGGSIGVVWRSAHRGEKPERFNNAYCEKLLELSFLLRHGFSSGEVYFLASN